MTVLDALIVTWQTKLDRAYWRIGQALSTYPLRPVPVVLYTTEQFHDITRSPAWAAGAYDGTIRVPLRGALENPHELDRVLAHEFTHALVHTLASRNVPTWLNEGLAAAFEADDLNWAEERVRAASQKIPLSRLRTSFGSLSGGQAQLAYATSALDKNGNETEVSTKGRHDPCVGIRAVPVGEAMMACVLADHFLRHRGQVGR